MTTLKYTVNFKRTLLATLIGLSVSQYCFALEELSDDTLSDSTGEGIALLPENFSMRFNGVDEAGVGAAGGGSIRLIPVGPLSATAEAKGFQKADVFVNGISLGQSKKNNGVGRDKADWGVGFGALGAGASDFARPIDSWGTTLNPWILKTVTDVVPSFSGIAKDVSYLTLEAPLMNQVIPTTGAESSAYNLKMGFYADAFMRDKNQPESITNKMQGLSNRIRLAAVWDGFSVNGSSLKVFRSLDGVGVGNTGGKYDVYKLIPQKDASGKVIAFVNDTANKVGTFNYGLSKSYNQTFGVAGVARLNSGKTDSTDARGSVSLGTVTRNIYQLDFSRNADNSVKRDTAGNIIYTQGVDRTSNPNTSDGVLQTYRPPDGSQATTTYNGLPSGGSFPSGGQCASAKKQNNAGAGCTVQEGVTARRFVATSTNTWTMPAAKSVLRISTQELLGTDAVGTPAFGGGVPNFNANSYPDKNAEGIFLYNPNINLVLGGLAQPLVLSTDGSNFSFELTRIPKNAAVYSKIYQKYSDISADMALNDGNTYLGNTCNINKCGGTLTIGGVNYQDSKATHSSITIGSTVYDATKNLTTAYTGKEAFGVSIGELNTVSGLSSSLIQDYTQVWMKNRQFNSSCNWLGTCTYSYGAWDSNWTAVSPQTGTTAKPDPYETTQRQNMNGQILGIQTTMPTNIQSTLNGMTPVGSAPKNNFGSAVVDGLLIQHFKFTTTGL
ncbi:hypothetical protein [Acinetobacter sp. WCHAc060025]|uniref:hypothetical protein n=1 Tax=Acinetobacter sp. WCHAc060025 TaxID=2518625 RepID=UPI0010237C3F|nr:hypothetical protein [Acinetobacter sp. WCHAc060025]RZG77103.1 hypothetical protein EXE09_04125 [Acinetobacter sp. WCHAc060025]